MGRGGHQVLLRFYGQVTLGAFHSLGKRVTHRGNGRETVRVIAPYPEDEIIPINHLLDLPDQTFGDLCILHVISQPQIPNLEAIH